MKRQKAFIFSFMLVFSGAARAYLRSPVFSPQMMASRNAANWYAQDFVFRAEHGKLKERPIWVLAGDSLSSGWGNNATLRDRYLEAFSSDIPIPATARDLLQHLPIPTSTWYAGTLLGYGLFGYLNPEWALHPSAKKKSDWVLIATAFAGAAILPEYNGEDSANRDPLELLKKVKHPERVKLVTLSAGANDLCRGVDLAGLFKPLEEKIVAIRGQFPRADFVVWKVPHVRLSYERMVRALDRLPERTASEISAKHAVQNYCRGSWEKHCHAVFVAPERMDRGRRVINQLYGKHFGRLFDSKIDQLDVYKDREIFDLMSSDCFHPSYNGHRWVKEKMVAFVKTKNI